MKSLELTNFPVLKTIEFMDYSFTNLEELTIRDNLALEKFAMGNNFNRQEELELISRFLIFYLT